MKSLPLAPSPFPAFYEHRSGHYLLDADHGWTQFNKDDLKQHMRRVGWMDEEKGLTELDHELMRIQVENKVDHAGSVAGHRKGLVSMSGSRILVTQTYKPVVLKKGPWPLLQLLCENLLDRVDVKQKPIFFSWCQVYLRSLKANAFMPGQALVLTGPHECGKSFLQNLLTTLFGGRAANPWPYMSGATDFNSELFSAEHMQVEDPPVNRLGDRLDFSAHIKRFTVNEFQSLHGKNRDIVTVQPRWRLTISINDEPYNLRAIPPVDDSTVDKLIIFKCAPKSVPCDSHLVEKREEFRLAVEAELGHFAYFLLNEWEIPIELRSGRFGVTHYHHPEVIAEINSQSPEFDVLTTVDEHKVEIFGCKGCWVGSSKDLAKDFRDFTDDEMAMRLGKSERALSLKLAVLAKKYPLRVHYKPTKTARLWVIYKDEQGHE